MIDHHKIWLFSLQCFFNLWHIVEQGFVQSLQETGWIFHTFQFLQWRSTLEESQLQQQVGHSCNWVFRRLSILAQFDLSSFEKGKEILRKYDVEI